jgi:phospholipase C
MRGRRPGLVGVLCAGLVLAACAAGISGGAEPGDGKRAPIDHIIVLFLENRSFDQLFGTGARAPVGLP